MWYNDYLSDFNEDFIKNYSENSDERYILQVDFEYPKKLWSSHKDLPFLSERRKNCLQYRRQRKVCHTHKSFKTSIR